MMQQVFVQAKEWFSLMAAREEKGQGLIEYALIILLIAIVVIAALTLLGPEIRDIYCDIYYEFNPTGTCP